MKVFAIFLLLSLLSLAFDISVDLLMGMSLLKSLRNLRTPFSVMTPPEYFFLFVLLLIQLIIAMASMLKKKKTS
jgi:hypothetical protein